MRGKFLRCLWLSPVSRQSRATAPKSASSWGYACRSAPASLVTYASLHHHARGRPQAAAPKTSQPYLTAWSGVRERCPRDCQATKTMVEPAAHDEEAMSVDKHSRGSTTLRIITYFGAMASLRTCGRRPATIDDRRSRTAAIRATIARWRRLRSGF